MYRIRNILYILLIDRGICIRYIMTYNEKKRDRGRCRWNEVARWIYRVRERKRAI